MSDLTTSHHALLGAPLSYLTPLERPSLREAQAWCHELATTHYENFHVATLFLPSEVRPHFESIYAFSRTADASFGLETTEVERPPTSPVRGSTWRSSRIGGSRSWRRSTTRCRVPASSW